MRLLSGMWSETDALLAASPSGTNPIDFVVSYLRSAAAAVGGWLGRTAPEAHLLGSGHAVAAIVAITGVVLGAAVVRCTATRRALRHRVSYAVLPTDTFDPTPEEIIRVASHLSRTRRAVFGSFVRRATALRVRLDQTADGRMLYSVEGPARASSLLRSLGYDEVEIRQVERPDDLPTLGPVDDSRPAPSSPYEKADHDDVDRDVDSVDLPDRLGEALKELGVEA
ncbi:MAG: hypothetical protein ACRDRT_12470 [Pseudonocardiaceae bacterium]